ncbi:MAG: SCP2 sterol-binding domain-containing protein [Acidimicrobiales bacterium]
MSPLAASELAGLIDERSDAEVNEAVAAAGTDALLKRAFATMGASFLAEAAAGEQAVVQWDVATPDGPRSWQVTVADGAASVAAGTVGTARVTLGVDMADLLRFLAGRLDGMQAFLSGRLRVSGDLMVAQAMQAWFAPVV